VELRPSEGGRNVVVRRSPDGDIRDVTPPGWNVRTLVHEYGGGASLVRGGSLFFSSFDDQRIYRQDEGDEPRPLTESPDRPRADRFADFTITPDGRLLVCVRERHLQSGEVVNDLVCLPAGGGTPIRLTGGRDFYSSPRVRPDGREIAWLEWDHPQMPWDGTELMTATLERSADDGGGGPAGGTSTPAVRLLDVRCVAGGPAESVLQPDWDAQGRLHLISDRSGWWNLYRCEELRPTATERSTLQPIDDRPVEQAKPAWVFGLRSYGFLADGRVAMTSSHDGLDSVIVVDPVTAERQPIDCEISSIAFLATHGTKVWVSGSGPRTPPCVLVADLGSAAPADSPPRGTVVFSARRRRIDPAFITAPEAVTAPATDMVDATSDDTTPKDAAPDRQDVVHALFYRPHNPDVGAPRDERPPLIVSIHGGPTHAAEASYSPEVQFWTTRGFAYAFVNYGGSTGYGRPYRERLKGA